MASLTHRVSVVRLTLLMVKWNPTYPQPRARPLIQLTIQLSQEWQDVGSRTITLLILTQHLTPGPHGARDLSGQYRSRSMPGDGQYGAYSGQFRQPD